MREARLIQDRGELEAAFFRLRSSDRLALDTEFMRERTYTRNSASCRSPRNPTAT